MTEHPQSQHMADAIEARMVELDMSPSDLVRATGLSGPGLLRVRRGEVRSYQHRTTAPICRALQWTPDSIDLILEGQEPVTVNPPIATVSQPASNIDAEQRLIAMERQIADMHHMMEQQELRRMKGDQDDGDSERTRVGRGRSSPDPSDGYPRGD